ncbi:hypothetical protein Tsubulata_005746 [Turnera subulata]|uniref:Pre-mRNA polyadenylation factor Fip1 domain-containing protein n=1 Tax=Turnera subulata TaxID=218843 RepID=A0A9Q0JK63_9ROSI|nr:hypothetical protein Tsubulata_005746 [Turnera subulata]
MEDDDEFGDLYTDVLRPFSSALSSAPSQPPQDSSSSPAPPPPLRPSIVLNRDDDDDDDDEILYGASQRKGAAPADRPADDVSNSAAGAGGGFARVPSSQAPAPPPEKRANPGDLDENDVNFDIEEAHAGTTGEDSGNPMMAMIPGLAGGGDEKTEHGVAGSRGGWGEEEDEEEDSDSDDDLQIVLNDTNPLGMERGGVIGDGEEDDDEDGDPLVIVADGTPVQGMEEQEWGGGGEDASGGLAGAEGEKKEGGDGSAGKGTPAVVGPKIGYSNHGFHHPFHSQFKYVRPGAPATVGPGGVSSQVRPPMNMGPMAGRGRGDWRPAGIKGGPSMQKGFHPGFAMPAWGNAAGRGFGGGLEFTLPSHKTIFDVDIDGFEEKPWKYPGVDMSDFFNFGLNEESWKDYCKQLEQHRLETTMQSKIRVYESGRAEQDYDPDLPPELAAATTGIHEVPADNSNLGKSDVGQSDLMKGSARVRPPIPTGRAIQVEGGYGERLPSMETRVPRIRDSDAIIEIVPQDSLDDDSSVGNGVLDGANNVLSKDDFRGGHAAGEGMADTEYFDDFPQAHTSKTSERRTPHMDSVRNNLSDEDEVVPLNPEAPPRYHRGSRGQPQHGSPHEERRTEGKIHGGSPHSTTSRSRQDKRYLDNLEEESTESMDGKRSPPLPSTVAVKDATELSNDDKDDDAPNEPEAAEESSGMERDEMTENEVVMSDTLVDEKVHRPRKRHLRNSHIGQPAPEELDDGEDSKAARSSETSKARSGSSKDYQKWQDGAEEEVVQDGRYTRTKRPFDENEQNFRRKDRDARQDMERHRTLARGREGSHPYDPSLPHHMPVKNEGYDRRKDRENPDGAWQRRDDDPHSRRSRTEDRKRERGDEMGSRHRNKLRESERSDRDDHLQSRKQLENGIYRTHHDKDSSSRHREREDSLKSRYDSVEDYHHKRRKDEEYLRREQGDKEDILYGHRETASRRRREREDVLDTRKRDDSQRIRENLDDYHSIRHKDDVGLQRERSERSREKEESYRLKQSHEENLLKREREEKRASVRSGRGVDDKAWTGHARLKDEYKGSDKEYQIKDAGRNSEHQKRRDRLEDEVFPHHRGRDDVYMRGNQFANEDRRSRQERPSIRIDRAADSSDNQRVHDRKHRENLRKIKESEGGDHSTSGSSRRNQEDQSGHTNDMGLKRTSEPGNGANEILVQPNPLKRRKEDASSEDEQHDSRRGRSKLERWTSHEERDYSISNKSTASLKFKEIDKNNNDGSSEASRFPDESNKKVEIVEKQPMAEERDLGEVENKDTDAKPLEDRHLDTVEKLKKRSERFKLPMPIEKDTSAIKKMENEALPPAKTDSLADSEIKPERPARKRRWISS